MKTLRGRMVLTLLGLAAVTLAVTSIVGILILRHYQTGRLDNEVTRLSQLASRPFFTDGPRRPDSGSRRNATTPTSSLPSLYTSPLAPNALSPSQTASQPSHNASPPSQTASQPSHNASPLSQSASLPSQSAGGQQNPPLCAELWRSPGTSGDTGS
jgi:hypothetical protein